MNTIRFSDHARQRMAQRGISLREVELTLRHGCRLRAAGALFIYMRRRDIPERLAHQEAEHLEGTTLMLSRDGLQLITVYRNKEGLRKIKQKSKTFYHNVA